MDHWYDELDHLDAPRSAQPEPRRRTPKRVTAKHLADKAKGKKRHDRNLFR